MLVMYVSAKSKLLFIYINRGYRESDLNTVLPGM